MIKNCHTPATRRSNRTILAETSAQAKSVAIGPEISPVDRRNLNMACLGRVDKFREPPTSRPVLPSRNPVTGKTA
jgi:hypothetical protein